MVRHTFFLKIPSCLVRCTLKKFPLLGIPAFHVLFTVAREAVDFFLGAAVTAGVRWQLVLVGGSDYPEALGVQIW